MIHACTLALVLQHKFHSLFKQITKYKSPLLEELHFTYKSNRASLFSMRSACQVVLMLRSCILIDYWTNAGDSEFETFDPWIADQYNSEPGVEGVLIMEGELVNMMMLRAELQGVAVAMFAGGLATIDVGLAEDV